MAGPFGGYGAAGFTGLAFSFFLLLVLWGLFWKGLGLWHSARHGNYRWFVAMFLVNTFGILELIYLFAILKLGSQELFSADASKTHNNHSHA